MNLKSIHSIYFIGIGGVGMSALARYFVAIGKAVGGYDKTASTITDSLIQQGVCIQFEADLIQLGAAFLDPLKTLVVFTPAVSESNLLLSHFRTHDFQVLKRSELLGIVTEKTKCLAVSGTHGKTTTSSILAHLLYQCNEKVTAFIGGISENYQSNFIQNGKLFNTEISIKHEYCICYVNKRDVPHEILHAIYFKHEKYRHLVKTLYENLENNLKIYKILNELRYPDNVIIDEFQAYLFSETNPWTFFKIKSLDKQSIKYYQKCVQFLSNIGYKTQNKSKPKL